jgi:hypothetical protein
MIGVSAFTIQRWLTDGFPAVEQVPDARPNG